MSNRLTGGACDGSVWLNQEFQADYSFIGRYPFVSVDGVDSGYEQASDHGFSYLRDRLHAAAKETRNQFGTLATMNQVFPPARRFLEERCTARRANDAECAHARPVA